MMDVNRCLIMTSKVTFDRLAQEEKLQKIYTECASIQPTIYETSDPKRAKRLSEFERFWKMKLDSGYSLQQERNALICALLSQVN
jgi:hypothetical protein